MKILDDQRLTICNVEIVELPVLVEEQDDQILTIDNVEIVQL